MHDLELARPNSTAKNRSYGTEDVVPGERSKSESYLIQAIVLTRRALKLPGDGKNTVKSTEANR